MMAILHILSIIVNWKQLLQISFHEIEGKIRQTLILCKTDTMNKLLMKTKTKEVEKKK